jgi:hypothetical protein
MLVLFVDTETAGLPTDYHADPFTNPEAWPRIVEIGWQVRQDVVLGHRREWCRENHGEYLIRPDGFSSFGTCRTFLGSSPAVRIPARCTCGRFMRGTPIDVGKSWSG